MEDHYINYNLFKSRTGFDPLKFFENNKSISYENFQKFLNSKKVKSPGKDYYDRAINYVNKVEEVAPALEPVLEVQVSEPLPAKEKAKPVKKQPAPRRRRGRKKKTNEQAKLDWWL